MFLSAFVTARTSEFVVTNKRVVMKTGFIRRTTVELRLGKIEVLSVDQSIVGRILGFGTVVVGGSGGSMSTFPTIANSLEFRRIVQEQAERPSE